MVQVLKVRDGKIKKNTELPRTQMCKQKMSSFSVICHHFVRCSTENFIISEEIRITARIDHLHICVDQVFKVGKG